MRRTGLASTAAAVLLVASAAGADSTHPRHVIYLHGRIVQVQQRARPRHPQFGYYELEKILAAFRDRGYEVSGEIRPKLASVSDSADRVVGRVRRLLDSGVPADHITVVGGSMGGAIALVASARLQNPNLRFCLLGVCLSAGLKGIRDDEGRGPSGHLLSIREASDDLTLNCPPWNAERSSRRPFVAREIVIDTGLSHGFLYRPRPEWLNPVVEWVEAR